MSIRSMVRAGKTVAEALESCVPMKEAMEDIQKAIDAEKEERKQTEGELRNAQYQQNSILMICPHTRRRSMKILIRYAASHTYTT